MSTSENIAIDDTPENGDSFLVGFNCVDEEMHQALQVVTAYALLADKYKSFPFNDVTDENAPELLNEFTTDIARVARFDTLSRIRELILKEIEVPEPELRRAGYVHEEGDRTFTPTKDELDLDFAQSYNSFLAYVGKSDLIHLNITPLELRLLLFNKVYRHDVKNAGANLKTADYMFHKTGKISILNVPLNVQILNLLKTTNDAMLALKEKKLQLPTREQVSIPQLEQIIRSTYMENELYNGAFSYTFLNATYQPAEWTFLSNSDVLKGLFQNIFNNAVEEYRNRNRDKPDRKDSGKDEAIVRIIVLNAQRVDKTLVTCIVIEDQANGFTNESLNAQFEHTVTSTHEFGKGSGLSGIKDRIKYVFGGMMNGDYFYSSEPDQYGERKGARFIVWFLHELPSDVDEP